MSKQPLTTAEKVYFVDEISKIFHDLSELFTPFTLLPQYVPPERPLSSENKRISLRALSRLNIIEERIKNYREAYLRKVDNPITENSFLELQKLFIQFYAAADRFINKEQPQRKAGTISDQILSLISEIKDQIELNLNVKSTHRANTVETISRATKRILPSINK